jgi:regulator of protease activity HflC (stomatin/prohibitin superfamily)
VLGSGAHFKWPWPIDKVYRFRAEQIQNFDVGFVHDPAREHEPVILWTVAHTKEENFLVANRQASSSQQTNQIGSKRTPPVSLLTVSIPIHFQITNLVAWAYNNEDAQALLQDLATRQVVKYLTSVDLADVMSQGQQQAAETLTSGIQKAADERNLGARIIFVGLQDIHPPVKVAPDYEKVVSAYHTKQAKILTARAYEINTNALAEAHATNVLNLANSESAKRKIDSAAKAALFTNQIVAFKASPSVYAQRVYLDTFLRATAPARKYVILTTNTHDVISFDLQDRVSEDLLQKLRVNPNAP